MSRMIALNGPKFANSAQLAPLLVSLALLAITLALPLPLLARAQPRHRRCLTFSWPGSLVAGQKTRHRRPQAQYSTIINYPTETLVLYQSVYVFIFILIVSHIPDSIKDPSITVDVNRQDGLL